MIFQQRSTAEICAENADLTIENAKLREDVRIEQAAVRMHLQRISQLKAELGRAGGGPGVVERVLALAEIWESPAFRYDRIGYPNAAVDLRAAVAGTATRTEQPA